MITGVLNRAELVVDAETGGVSLVAMVELYDDVLGSLGVRRHVVQDPAIVAQVTAFADAMLPTLSASLGIEVSRP